jgi:rhodanese-related sulfurtransferase
MASAIGNSASGQAHVSTNLNVGEFKAMIDSLSDEVILDLRTPDELKAGIIPNANHLDYFAKDFEKRINGLSRTTTYFLYCASGARGDEAKALMEAKGFNRVYNLHGGFINWKKEKMPAIPFISE